MKYLRLIVAGVAVPISTLLVITVVAAGYGVRLGFAARGAPDQRVITNFAASLGRDYWTILQILLAVPSAFWGSRTFREAAALYGAMVGALAAAIELAVMRNFAASLLVEAGLMVGAGWLGGLLAASRYRAAEKPVK